MNNLIFDKLKIFLFLAYISIFVFIRSSMLNSLENLPNLANRAQVAILVFSLLIVFFDLDFSLSKWITIITVFSICLIEKFILVEYSPLLAIITFSLLLRNISYKRILKILLITLLALYITIILLWSMGIIPDRSVLRDTGSLRQSLGFWHPNTTGMLFLEIFLLGIIVIKKHINLFLILGNILNIILFVITNSRTSCALIVLATIIYLFTHYKTKYSLLINSKKVGIIASMMYILATFFSYILANLYSPFNKFIVLINKLLSGRIGLSQTFVKEYPINLLGTNIVIQSPNFLTDKVYNFNYAVLDNAYLKILLNFGILTVILYAIIIYLTFKYMDTSLTKDMFIIYVIYLILSFNEQSTLFLEINFFFLGFSFYFSNIQKKIKWRRQYENSFPK